MGRKLITCPEFKKSITIGKALIIIENLIDGKETSKNLSKKVKLINYLRFIRNHAGATGTVCSGLHRTAAWMCGSRLLYKKCFDVFDL